MALDLNSISIAHWFLRPENHRCGYCKSDNGSISYGMWAESLTVQDYQNLIDRGWRRSGRYCYKPIMNEICCPQYTIRCDALNFKVSKSQKKILKKFNKYLNDGILHNDEKTSESESGNNADDSQFVMRERPKTNFDYSNLSSTLMQTSSDLNVSGQAASCSSINDSIDKTDGVISEISTQSTVVKTQSDKSSPSSVKKGLGADPNKLPCKKAKLMRKERKQQKLNEKGMNFVQPNANNEAKTLEQFVYDIPDSCKDKLKIKLVCLSNGEDTFSDLDIEYEVYRQYQMTIHNDPPDKCSKKAFTRFLVNTPLKVKLEKMSTTHESFGVCYRLYTKYQMFVHGDAESDCDVNQFVDFLVDSPLKAETWANSDMGYGSFHQQYWIDNKLVAVGVIDILPKCISSVYFFYDPDYRSLTLGTYGSLREVDFTRKLNQSVPNIKYYYMGFYIHSCPKMRYKGRLNPSYLLCPETYKWFSITECIVKLEQDKYCRFNTNLEDIDENACSDKDIDQIKIFVGDCYVKFKFYKYRSRERKVYQNIGKLIGKKCVDSLLFVDQRH